MAITKPPTAELDEALKDLAEAVEEATEEGYPIPSPLALSNAEALLRRMYDIMPMQYEVYPNPYGEIAIDAPGEGSSIIMLCGPDGGLIYLANLPDGYKRLSFASVEELPDDFLSQALASLPPRSR